MPLPNPPGRPPGWIPPGQRVPGVILGGSKVVGVGHRVVASSGAGPSGLIDGHDLSEIMTILGGRAVRMFLPFFETDAADDTPVQDAGPRAHHFLKHNTSDYPPYIKGHVLAYRLNGLVFPNGEAFDMADHDDFSFGDGNTDSPFSIGIAVRMHNNLGVNYFISRYDMTTDVEACEYRMYTAPDGTLVLRCHDHDTTNYIGRTWNVPLAIDTWYIIFGTYDGSCVQEGIRLYVNGVRVDNANATLGDYTAMHNEVVVTSVGYIESAGGVLVNFFDGDCWGPFITGKRLSDVPPAPGAQSEVVRLTNLYRKVLGL